MTNTKPEPEPRSRVLTVREAAGYLGLSVTSIRRLVSAGQLPVVRLTERRIGIDRDDLDKRVEERKRLVTSSAEDAQPQG